MQDTLASHRVDHALGSLEGILRGGLVAGEEQLAHLLDGGAVLAALGREVLVAGNCLTGTLASLFGLGHICILKTLKCLLSLPGTHKLNTGVRHENIIWPWARPVG